MHIAIAGTGEVGEFYGRRWIAAGHTVTFTHARDHDKARALAAALGPAASFEPSLSAAPRPDVAVLAARLESFEEALDQLGDLQGMPLIDAVNPFSPDRTGLVDLGGRTAADVVGESLSRRGGALHVKALHSDGVQRIIDTAYPVALFIAGDDPGAVAIAETLVTDAGLVPVFTGALETASLSEPPGPLFGQGYDRASAQAALAPTGK